MFPESFKLLREKRSSFLHYGPVTLQHSIAFIALLIIHFSNGIRKIVRRALSRSIMLKMVGFNFGFILNLT